MPRMESILVRLIDGSWFQWYDHADNKWGQIDPQQIESVEQVIKWTGEEWVKEKIVPVRGPCICKRNQEAVKCPQHGNQEANREPCPLCGAVLGYCAQGEYCTREDCRYVS